MKFCRNMITLLWLIHMVLILLLSIVDASNNFIRGGIGRHQKLNYVTEKQFFQMNKNRVLEQDDEETSSSILAMTLPHVTFVLVFGSILQTRLLTS
jgi:hypothetical protein